MKKFISFFSIIFVLFSLSNTTYAGSVPEDLLHYDGAQVFFGEIISYKESFMDCMGSVEVIPIIKIKGDVAVDEIVTYSDPVLVGARAVGDGALNLFAYFDENNPTYIFETTTHDTKTLKLKNTTGDMWDRFEKYLNDGKFEKAEDERLNRIDPDYISIGEKISLTEFLGADKAVAQTVTFSLNGIGQKYYVDKDTFFEIADDIMLTNVEDKPMIETDGDNVNIQNDGIYIDVYHSDSKLLSYAFISNNCTVDKCSLFMSRLPVADYEIDKADMQKLYNLLPQEALKNQQDYVGKWLPIISWAIIGIICCVIISVIIKLTKNKINRK